VGSWGGGAGGWRVWWGGELEVVCGVVGGGGGVFVRGWGGVGGWGGGRVVGGGGGWLGGWGRGGCGGEGLGVLGVGWGLEPRLRIAIERSMRCFAISRERTLECRPVHITMLRREHQSGLERAERASPNARQVLGVRLPASHHAVHGRTALMRIGRARFRDGERCGSARTIAFHRASLQGHPTQERGRTKLRPPAPHQVLKLVR